VDVSDNPGEIEVLVGILEELKRFNEFLANTAPKKPKPAPPSFDPAWDKSPEEIARIQALPNNSRIPAKPAAPGFERDYSAYHLPGTVYPYGRNV
jgi:hypothetical protein